jgi:hypothetical protein
MKYCYPKEMQSATDIRKKKKKPNEKEGRKEEKTHAKSKTKLGYKYTHSTWHPCPRH